MVVIRFGPERAGGTEFGLRSLRIFRLRTARLANWRGLPRLFLYRKTKRQKLLHRPHTMANYLAHRRPPGSSVHTERKSSSARPHLSRRLHLMQTGKRPQTSIPSGRPFSKETSPTCLFAHLAVDGMNSSSTMRLAHSLGAAVRVIDPIASNRANFDATLKCPGRRAPMCRVKRLVLRGSRRNGKRRRCPSRGPAAEPLRRTARQKGIGNAFTARCSPALLKRGGFEASRIRSFKRSAARARSKLALLRRFSCLRPPSAGPTPRRSSGD